MMPTPVRPGFQDAVHDAQQTFRMLMKALAYPGQPNPLAIALTPPPGLMPACAAACLTVLDLETHLWVQPGMDAAVLSWLGFHSGCRFTQNPRRADFALIWDAQSDLNLDRFNWGTATDPEASTTLLLQVDDLSGGESVTLQGPGILTERAIAPRLPAMFWMQWAANHQAYPLGVDVFLFAHDQVLGLPRTSAAVRR